MIAACGAATGGTVVGADVTVVGSTLGGRFGVDVAGVAPVLGAAEGSGVVMPPEVGGNAGVRGPQAESRARSITSIKNRCIRYPFAFYDGYLA